MAKPDYEIVIVGAGPAGLSTALHLQRLQPELLPATLVLEKVSHPRTKLCGGGLSWRAERVLRNLSLELAIPSFPVHEAHFVFRGQTIRFQVKDMLRITRRDVFDAALADAARSRGVKLQENTPVLGWKRQGEYILVHTPEGELTTRVLVGADGANGTVRLGMGLPEKPRVSRLMEILTPADDQTLPEYRNNTVVFDFSWVPNGVQGYYWDFPSYVKGRPFMNRGVFDSRVVPQLPKGALKDSLMAALEQRGISLNQHSLEGHPERWFDPSATYSQPQVLLAGDAAGIEPLMGEGIAYALQYGEVVSQALADAWRSEDFRFVDYRERLLKHSVGRSLTLKTRLAHFAYGGLRWSPVMRLSWMIVNLVFRLSLIKMHRFNYFWTR
ncbi:MAG: FAD-dependent oxidoreductase [Chloroflexi bacterium]|nr:FAD-dependent oxidoreductase [Chloroflexota bacterium]